MRVQPGKIDLWVFGYCHDAKGVRVADIDLHDISPEYPDGTPRPVQPDRKNYFRSMIKKDTTMTNPVSTGDEMLSSHPNDPSHQRALDRAAKIPAGPTLIDTITEEDWIADHSADRIEVGQSKSDNS
jgi:hypothetical protein